MIHLVVELKQQYFCVYIQSMWLLCYLLKLSFFLTCFALFLFDMNLQYYSLLEQYLIVILMKISFVIKCLLLFYSESLMIL